MPRLPGPAIVAAGVALLMLCVSAVDALSVLRDVHQAAGDGALDAAAVERATGRSLRGDAVGLALAVVFAAAAAVLFRRERRRAPAPAHAVAASALPAPALASPSAVEPREARDAARFLESDPDEDGPDAHEVADAVDRVRRQVVARYTRAEADRDELAGIVDTSFDAFVGVDAEGRIIRWNPRAEQLFGWSREEAIGRPVVGTAFGPPRATGAVRPDELRTLAAGRADEPAEMVAWHRSGRSFPVEVALSIGDDSSAGHVFAFVRDISRRRRSEQRERAIHRVTRALAEADTMGEATGGVLSILCELYDWSIGATWVEDGDGRIKVARQFSGAGARLRHWREACHGASLEIGQGLPGQAWLTGGVAFREDAATDFDDPRAPQVARSGMRSALALPLLLEGEVVGVIELLAATRRPIEAWLLDDFAAIQQVLASFVERRRARESSERAKREFLTLVSHELRTPLTSIMGYVQMLRARMRDAGEAEQRSVEIIARNSERLHRLVADLLFAAEVSRGEMRLEPGSVCLGALVRDAADAARPAAEGRSVEVVVDAVDVGAVEGDTGRLAQVVDNLLSNAIKFSHEGGRVELVLRPDGDAVTLAVRDHGIGVAMAELERIATQFFRAGTARSAQVPGMGLGLSLSKAIVEAHGGRLAFDSLEGEGTTVTLRLPAAPAAVLAA